MRARATVAASAHTLPAAPNMRAHTAHATIETMRNAATTMPAASSPSVAPVSAGSVCESEQGSLPPAMAEAYA